MAESQSRYSIVERLTSKKLELMASRSRLIEEITLKLQCLQKLQKDLQNWKHDVQEDVKRAQRMKEIEIEKANLDHENAQSQMVQKEKVYDNQIKAVEEALKSIEEISKTSPTIQS